jgi:hypothetical protein
VADQKEAIDLSGKTEEEPRSKPSGKNRDRRGQREREDDASGIYTNINRREREWERDIRVRIERTQARLVEWLEGREDYELATVIKEDGKAMVGGIIYICGSAVWLRAPILAAMTIVEPMVAFGRLAKVLSTRWIARRQRKQQEWEEAQQQAEWEAQQAEQQVSSVG